MTNPVLKLAKDIGLPHWYQSDEVVNAELVLKFAVAIESRERQRLADALQQMPLNDTANSIAIWIREGGHA